MDSGWGVSEPRSSEERLRRGLEGIQGDVQWMLEEDPTLRKSMGWIVSRIAAIFSITDKGQVEGEQNANTSRKG
jgi:hypothetical protein